MANEARIDVVIGSDKAQSGANALNSAVNGIKANFTTLVIAAVAVEQTLVKVWQSAKAGAQFEETLARLNRQMGGFHSNANAMITDLQGISRGTLGMSDAATMASRALATGLDPNQVNTFTQAAMLLKDVMGTDLPQAFDQMVTAAAGGRGAILRNIGIFVDMDEEIKRLAVSTGRTTGQITQQEKAMLMQAAVADKVAAASRRLSDGMVSDADRLKAIEVKFEDYWTGIQQGAKAATVAVLTFGESVIQSGMAFRKWMDEKGITELLVGKGAAARGHVPTEFEFVSPRTYGKGAPTGETALPLPSSMQRDAIQAAADLNTKLRQGQDERITATLKAEQDMLDQEVRMQLRTAEEIVTRRGELEIQGLAKHAEFLSQARAAEQVSYAKQKQITGDSIQENIALEKAHKDFQTENAIATAAAVQALGIQSDKNEADRTIARMEAEQRSGERSLTDWTSYYNNLEALRKQDMDDIEAYYQGEVEMGISRYASDQEMAVKERVLLRDQMAFKLRLTQEEADRIIFIRNAGDIQGALGIANRSTSGMSQTAIEGLVESGAGRDIRLAERANDSFFAGWSRGMQKYVADRDSALGMSADMARRVAQGMEQGFQRFFFDAMTGKFESFKDVLKGVLDFAAQMISQLAAQMVTVGLIKPGAAALAGMFSGGGGATVGASDLSGKNFPGFTSSNALVSGKSMAVTMPVTIINQVDGAKVETKQSTTAGGMPQLEVLVTSMVNKAVGQGRMDKTMKSRFGMTPGER